MWRSINTCTSWEGNPLWGLCTLHLPVPPSAEPSLFRWCYLHFHLQSHIFVLLLIQILFFKIQVFSRVYNDKSAMKAARVKYHTCVPTSLLGRLYCPNNGNRAFSAQQCKNYLLQVQYVIHSLLVLFLYYEWQYGFLPLCMVTLKITKRSNHKVGICQVWDSTLHSIPRFKFQALIISQNEKLFGLLDGFSQIQIIRKKRVILYVYT